MSTKNDVWVRNQMQTIYAGWTMEGYPHFVQAEYIDIFAMATGITKGGLRVLDAGCGEGLVASRIKALGNEVIGVDICAEAISEAVTKRRVDRGIVCDISHVPLGSETFDLIICVGVLLYHFDLKRPFTEFHRLLKPGGELLVVDHHRRNPYTKLHFSRPNIVDRLLEGRDNIPRRALDEKIVAEGSSEIFAWQTPAYLSMFTQHPHPIINFVHKIARVVFRGVRWFSKKPWTGNMIVIRGVKK